MIGLLTHLKSHPKDRKQYSLKICPLMNGSAFKAITQLACEPDYRKVVANYLLSKPCKLNIQPEVWSLISAKKITQIEISVYDVPPRALPLLDWSVVKASLEVYKAKLSKEAKAYNGWCRFIKPKQFSREIWTGELWVVLTPSCIADMARWKSQRAAINLIADVRVDGQVISKPELVTFARRLTRLLAVRKSLTTIRDSPKKVNIYLEKKIQNMISIINGQIGLNQDFLSYTKKADKVQERIEKLQSIMAFVTSGASSSDSSDILERVLKLGGSIDVKDVITWEAVSLFACMDPSDSFINLISRLISGHPRCRLPVDLLIKRAFSSGSMSILLAIIGNTKSFKTLSLISGSIQGYRKTLGEYNCLALFESIRFAKFPEGRRNKK